MVSKYNNENYKNLNARKSLYKLERSYFRERTATLSINNIRIEKEVSKECPQRSYCGPAI